MIVIVLLFSYVAFGTELSPLQDALYNGKLAEAEQLIKDGNLGTPSETPYEEPIQIAVRRGYVGIVRLLVAGAVDTNFRFSDGFYTVLHVAAMWCQDEIVNLLIGFGHANHFAFAKHNRANIVLIGFV